jgi:tRNA 2-selenouridine synthase
VRRLLGEHYDPAYERSINRNYVRFGESDVVNLSGPDELAFARLARTLATPSASASRAGSA